MWVPSGARHQSWGDTCQCVTFVWIFYIFTAILLKQFLHNLRGKLLTPKIHIVRSDIHTTQNCHSKHYTLSISFKFQHQVYHFQKKFMSDSQLGYVGCSNVWNTICSIRLGSQLLLFHQVQFAKLPTSHCQLSKCTKLLEMLFKLCRIRILQAAHLPNGCWVKMTNQMEFFLMEKTWPQAMDETNLNG